MSRVEGWHSGMLGIWLPRASVSQTRLKQTPLAGHLSWFCRSDCDLKLNVFLAMTTIPKGIQEPRLAPSFPLPLLWANLHSGDPALWRGRDKLRNKGG